jgi:hypothetical protein
LDSVIDLTETSIKQNAYNTTKPQNNLLSANFLTSTDLSHFTNVSLNTLLNLLAEYEETNDKLRQEVWNLHNRLICKQCGEHSIDALLQPCNHQYLCNICASSIQNCPICNKKISQKIIVYNNIK